MNMVDFCLGRGFGWHTLGTTSSSGANPAQAMKVGIESRVASLSRVK
jgi:hypothetical protein